MVFTSWENLYKSVIQLLSFEKLSLRKCLWRMMSIEKKISISHQNHWFVRIFSWLLNFCLLSENECKRVTKIWNNSWGVLPSCFLPRQAIKTEAFFQWWWAFEQHNPKPIKKLIQTSWFKINFVVYLSVALKLLLMMQSMVCRLIVQFIHFNFHSNLFWWIIAGKNEASD